MSFVRGVKFFFFVPVVLSLLHLFVNILLFISFYP